MKHELAMRLFSRRPLIGQVANDQISALSNFGSSLMRPDKWGRFEPIKTPFDPLNIESAVRGLSSPAGTFMYRKGRPTHLTGVIWNLSHPELWDRDESGNPIQLLCVKNLRYSLKRRLAQDSDAMVPSRWSESVKPLSESPGMPYTRRTPALLRDSTIKSDTVNDTVTSVKKA